MHACGKSYAETIFAVSSCLALCREEAYLGEADPVIVGMTDLIFVAKGLSTTQQQFRVHASKAENSTWMVRQFSWLRLHTWSVSCAKERMCFLFLRMSSRVGYLRVKGSYTVDTSLYI